MLASKAYNTGETNAYQSLMRLKIVDQLDKKRNKIDLFGK
jgi:hypothetical protein